MLDLQELLFSRGLPKDAKTKLVRHQDSRWDLERLLAMDQFEVYQAHQAKPIFNCAFIVSLLGQRHGHARLMGVYAVRGCEGPGPFAMPDGFIYPDMPASEYRYSLERVSGFEDLEKRVVVQWQVPRAWHQWLKPIEVVEVLPRGYVTEFPGYDDFILSYGELREIIRNPMANREWHRMLGAVAGIYLITDRTTGKLYVGSASGADGILGRWTEYASSGHGDNRLLRDLVDSNPSHCENFSFTLLRTLPRTLAREEVISYESLYKAKLGSRAHGLNAN